jgi:hypothetical protein
MIAVLIANRIVAQERREEERRERERRVQERTEKERRVQERREQERVKERREQERVKERVKERREQEENSKEIDELYKKHNIWYIHYDKYKKENKLELYKRAIDEGISRSNCSIIKDVLATGVVNNVDILNDKIELISKMNPNKTRLKIKEILNNQIKMLENM